MAKQASLKFVEVGWLLARTEPGDELGNSRCGGLLRRMLLDHVGPGSEHRLAAYVVVSLLAGVRTEEARALTWAEVDLDAGTVAVYRSVRAKGDTKTRKSRRLLKLPRKAAEALREHRKRQAAERLQAGGKWQDHDLVFCREDGTPLDRWQVRREFAVITKAAGLGEQWAPRELRHSLCPSSAPAASASRTSAT